MAAEPAYVMILMGLGLQEFSMNPASIPKVKKMLRMSRFEESRALADRVFQFSTASEIERHVRTWMAERFPGDYVQSHRKELRT
jgi:phosphotransferase system enzyme I (PtsI)